MSCRFTTCLDSRKTGHRVQRSVFEKDVERYSRGLPECLRPVDEGRGSNQNVIRPIEALGPFVLDTLKDFGDSLENSFLCKYEELGSQPGAARSATADRHLLGPYEKILMKLSKMEAQVNANDFAQEARKELRKLEDHVEDTKSQWAMCFSTPSKKKPESAQKRTLDDLRQRFHLGPDAPHLSLLGDVPEIRASYAYLLCGAGNANFAFRMAFEDLCSIKARESGGTVLNREFVELMAIPKIAVRTLSALRSQT